MEPTTSQRTTRSTPRRARRVSGPAAPARSPGAGDDLVLVLVRDHSARMMSVARRYSLCRDDAHDAWQRSVEILLRRASTLEPATAPAWLATVVKHEALAIRQERVRSLGPDEVEPDSWVGGVDLEADSERLDRLATAAEALQSLKPNEAEALMMLASGMSYREIGEAKGWTYTKVNRLLTEGRRSFRDRVRGIESGEECERWRPVLLRIAGGEADRGDRASIRPHLRRCVGCRATLRQEGGRFAGIAILLPGIALPATPKGDGRLSTALSGTRGWLSEIAVTVGVRAQNATELVGSGKAVAAAASAVALAGSGVAAQVALERPRPARVERPAAKPQRVATPKERPVAAESEQGAGAGEVRPGESAGRDDPITPERPPGRPAAEAEFDPMATEAPAAPREGRSPGVAAAAGRAGGGEPARPVVRESPGAGRSRSGAGTKGAPAEFGP